jgi:hypothetical protein
MRAHKGLGMTMARKLRLEKEAMRAEEKAKRISPFHIRKANRVARVSIENERRVVLKSELDAALKGSVSANRQPTGKQRRKMLQFMRWVTEEKN